MKKQLLQKTATFLFILSLFCFNAHAQNLVPNPSFETQNACPSNNIFTVANWFNPNSASPDYFHPCGTGWTVPPSVLFGPQSAHTGSGFAGGGWYGLGGGWYDYMQVQLTSPMVAGTVYSVSMWVALASGVRFASDDFGIYISNYTFKSTSGNAAVTNSVVATTPGGSGVFTTFTPQIKPAPGAYITSTNWTLLSGTYTAVGGENAITIGCFNPWATTTYTAAALTGDSRCYYYYDDVSVEPVSSPSVAPNLPVAIVGATNVCGAATQIFSVAPVAGATSYTWSLPIGWAGTSGTNTISVTTNTASGTLSVTASNTIGTSPAQTLAVTVTNVSASITVTGNTLFVNTASTYTWVDCNNSNSVVATGTPSYSPSQSGNYGVIISQSGCTETSSCQSILIAPAQPGTIAGATTLCSGATQVYNILAVPNATSYTWALPPGWTGSSTSNSITITVNSAPGTITVTANNQAGPSSPQTLSVTVNTATVSVTQTGSTLFASSANTYQWVDCDNDFSVVATGSVSYTPSQSGSYAVIVTQSGCTATSTCNSVLLVPVQPGSIMGATTLCAGSAVIYSVSPVLGATSYFWNFPSGWSGSSTTNTIALVTNTASGTVSVAAVNASGQSPLQTLVITITNVTAAITQTSNVLYANSATSYTWLNCNSSYSVVSTANSSFAPSQSGSYAVAIAQNGCVDTSACLQVNISTVGLAHVAAEIKLSVYPNPADQQILIQAESNKYPLTVSVRDYVGRLIYSSEAKTAEAIEIATGSWAPGIYMLQLESEGQRLQTKKIIITR